MSGLSGNGGITCKTGNGGNATLPPNTGMTGMAGMAGNDAYPCIAGKTGNTSVAGTPGDDRTRGNATNANERPLARQAPRPAEWSEACA